MSFWVENSDNLPTYDIKNVKKLTFLLLAITNTVNIHLLNLYAEKITHQAVKAESIPKVERYYKEEGIEKLEISIPAGRDVEVMSETKGKVYFIDYDNTESIIADIEVLEIKGKSVIAKIRGRSSTILIEKGNLVRFLIDENQKRILAATRVYEAILDKITSVENLCDLNRIEKDEIQGFIREHKDNKHISELERELEKRRARLKEEDNGRFRAVKQEIDRAGQVEKVRELARRYHEKYTCSEYSEELDKYAEQRAVAIEKMVVDTRTKNVVTPKIAAGYYHSIALRSDGTVWTWGENDFGQLGDRTTLNRTIPIQVSGLNEVVDVAGGGFHTIALKSDGTVWSWGYNKQGQLGNESTITSTAPMQVRKLSGIVAIACGGFHTIALKSDGTVWTWGKNDTGQLGVDNKTDTYKAAPVQVNGISDIIAIKGGAGYTIALKSDGSVWIWGDNKNGQLGDGTVWSRNIPVKVEGLNNVIAIAGGGFHAIALNTTNSVYAWGSNEWGQLGEGTTTNRNTPVQVSSINDIVSIAGGYDHTVVLRSDGTVWVWGDNNYGQLGEKTVVIRESVPMQVNDISNVTSLTCGSRHALVLKSDGSVYSWGNNANGQLGNGTTKDSTMPVQVANINLGKATLSHEVNQRENPKYNNRGTDYLEKGQYDLAISDFSKALEVNPHDVLTYYDRGFAYYKMGQFDLAISDFSKAVEISPRLASAYCNRGNAFCNKGEYDRAILDYSRAIEINPKDATTYYNRSIAYSKKEKYIEAREDVYKAQNLGYQVHVKYLKDIEKKALAKRDE